MEAYTIEEIELLRRKGGMTYREAVTMLENHGGSMAQALIDLEQNGCLKEDAGKERTSESRLVTAERTGNSGEAGKKAVGFLQKTYRCRMKIHKGNVPVINVSAVYACAALIFAPHITVAGIIISMILGYRFSFSQMDKDFILKAQPRNINSDTKIAVEQVTDATEPVGTEPVGAEPVMLDIPEEWKDISDRVPTIQVPAQA